MLYFHTGYLYGKSATANATPQSFGTLQNVTIDVGWTNKELFGQYSDAVAVGQGNRKITGKAAAANIQARFINDLYMGGTLTAGETAVANREIMAAIPTTPFQLTVAQSATFVEDWEVLDSATGLPFVKVASAPAAGQYSVAAGVFTFNTGDVGKFPLISYSYTIAASGQTISMAQGVVGPAPTFSIILAGGYGAAGIVLPALKLYACVASKLAFGTKLNDFAIPNFEWMCMANPSGKVMDWSTNDKSG